jgi:hypothetical protein
MSGIPLQYLIPLAGAMLWLLTIFQALVGYRKIQFKGKMHLRVHKTVAWILLISAPVHGLAATSFFLGWPFKLV